ncbi:Ferric reductase like transmembrane component [Pleurostoma richardsiae]|uniref:Ferric reductase like transmembrane component n=1 Tax=Pleurostoma richardsiae TaxID=41990 RepID=A0AA38S382_9PEZI|nr:Ferric reductase like transmembrane component [Pleurostoma richardsiae]
MAFQRRRIAAPETFTFLHTLGARETAVAGGTATTMISSETPNPTIAPYHSGLAGVNQPVNILFKDMLWWSLGIIAMVILTIRILDIGWSRLRQVSAMSVARDKQEYWRFSQWSWMPSLKKNLIYAPIWKKRHNREIKLSSAVNIGTLPSRLHSILLGGYLGSNLIYMFVLNWHNENRFAFCAELRGRSGTLAAVNMVPLIILAGRNNPLIGMLKISFDTYNLFHRWIGRVVVIEALIHTLAWAIVQVTDGGWESVRDRLLHERFIASGTAGTLAMTVLAILAVSPVRHAFYETFLNTHIILAFIIFVMTWIHCATAAIPGGLPQLPYVIAIFVLWMCERLVRLVRLAYYNWSSKGFTEAIAEAMPGECCRLTVYLPRHVEVPPGSHAYIRAAGLSPWENHPFSIAWTEHQDESLPISEKEPLALATRKASTTVSFVIGAHTGFTRKLYNHARAQGRRAVRLRAAFEGPYGGHHSLDSYGHCVLIAGATGITHHMSYLPHLIGGYGAGTVATRRITLVWIVRDYEALEWVRPWMDAVLRMPGRRDILAIKLFITRPKNSREIVSASNTVQMFPGRPNIPLLIRKEVAEQVGAMAVSVCGPGALADDVRAAVRGCLDEGSVVDFIEESFTW